MNDKKSNKRQREVSIDADDDKSKLQLHEHKSKLKNLLKNCRDEVAGLLAPSQSRRDQLKRHKTELLQQLKLLEAKLLLVKMAQAKKIVLDSIPHSEEEQES